MYTLLVFQVILDIIQKCSDVCAVYICMVHWIWAETFEVLKKQCQGHWCEMDIDKVTDLWRMSRSPVCFTPCPLTCTWYGLWCMWNIVNVIDMKIYRIMTCYQYVERTEWQWISSKVTKIFSTPLMDINKILPGSLITITRCYFKRLQGSQDVMKCIWNWFFTVNW